MVACHSPRRTNLSIEFASFDRSDLTRVPCPHRNPVVLKSGGPILDLLAVEGDNAICEWAEDGEKVRRIFPVACLYRCVPLTDGEGFLSSSATEG